MSKKIKVDLPDEWQLELELQAEQAGMKPEDYMAELLEEYLDEKRRERESAEQISKH